MGFRLTGGQVHDSQVASELLEGFDISQSNIIADKAYGTAKLRQYIEDKAGVYTIPPKENTKDKWTCDYHVYCERHLIENFFNQWQITSLIRTSPESFNGSLLMMYF